MHSHLRALGECPTLVSCLHVGRAPHESAIADYALERVRRLIGAYTEALDRTRDADELTHRLLLKLVRRQVVTEAELEA